MMSQQPFGSNPGSSFSLKSESIPKQSQQPIHQQQQQIHHQQSITPQTHYLPTPQTTSPVHQHTGITQNMLTQLTPPQSSSQISSPEPIEQEMPSSPTRPGYSSNSSSGSRYPRDSQRRVGHIHAEQKRRYNIKNGFDMLHSLIPQLQQNTNSKLSKAAMLQKGAEYIKVLRSERLSIEEKIESLKKERDQLNNSLK